MATKDQKNCVTQKGYTDAGKSATAGILNAAALAVAGINTAAAIAMALKQWEIANDYLEIAKWYRNYYNNTFKPWEDKLIAEVRALQPYVPHYDTAVGRSRNTARVMFKNKADTAIQCTSAYCTGTRNALLKDQLNMEAATKAAMSGVGWRNEYQLMKSIEDLIWKRKEQLLNIGRDRMVSNIAFANLAAGIYSDLGKQAGVGAAGAMHYLGYAGERRDTVYPSVMGQGQGQYPSMRLPEEGTWTHQEVPTVETRPLTDSQVSWGLGYRQETRPLTDSQVSWGLGNRIATPTGPNR